MNMHTFISDWNMNTTFCLCSVLQEVAILGYSEDLLLTLGGDLTKCTRQCPDA